MKHQNSIFRERKSIFQDGEIESASSDLDQAITLDPENVDYRKLRAELRYEAEEYSEAIADFSVIIEICSDQELLADTYTKRAIFFEKLGMYEKLIDDLSWLINKGIDTSGNYVWRGYHNTQLGYYQKAISDFSKALELSPDSSKILLQLAQSHYFAGEYQAAVDYLTQILESEEKQPTFLAAVYHWRGKTHSRLGNIPQALADFNKVLHIQGAEAIEDVSQYTDIYSQTD